MSRLTGPWKPSAREFGLFVTALGKRYSGTYHGLPKVSFFSIWNEPNYGIDLAPEAVGNSVEVSAGRYRSMVDAAWSAWWPPALGDEGQTRFAEFLGAWRAWLSRRV